MSRSIIRAPGVRRAVTIARRRVLRTLSPFPLIRCAIWYTYYSEASRGMPDPISTPSIPPHPGTGRTMHLVIRDLSKTYPNGTRALKDVSLDVPKGMFGLLGRNGAGKSTLMRIIATLQEPDEGTITLGDLDVLRQKGEVRKTLGYLPQSFGFHPKAKAQRLLEHFAILKGIEEPGVRRDVVEALLRQTNLWDVRAEKLGTFSGGMRQRFGVAVALLGNPKLIIVDEPTAGLDPEERVR